MERGSARGKPSLRPAGSSTRSGSRRAKAADQGPPSPRQHRGLGRIWRQRRGSGGPAGKVLVDAGIAVSRPQVASALATLGPEPVRHLINTHWHFDHADGNEWVHDEGAAIIAHENTRKHLKTMQRVEDWDFNFPALASGAIPTEVFSDRKTLTVNRSTLELQYYGPAHTDSDIWVYFVEADILHAADTFWNGIYPFIDYSTGGSIDGMIRAADANLAKATEKTIVISGHGPGMQSRRSEGVPRHARCHPRQRRKAQEAGAFARRGRSQPSRQRPSTQNGGSSSSRRFCSLDWCTKASERERSTRKLDW